MTNRFNQALDSNWSYDFYSYCDATYVSRLSFWSCTYVCYYFRHDSFIIEFVSDLRFSYEFITTDAGEWFDCSHDSNSIYKCCPYCLIRFALIGYNPFLNCSVPYLYLHGLLGFIIVIYVLLYLNIIHAWPALLPIAFAWSVRPHNCLIYVTLFDLLCSLLPPHDL